LKQARLTSEEAVIQKKIAAAMYVPENLQASESWTSNEHSNRKILMSTWRKLPNATMTRVDVFEGEAPEFEESRREFHLIEERRVKEVTRIFEDHGLVITWPSK
jgi:hypothetical protein